MPSSFISISKDKIGKNKAKNFTAGVLQKLVNVICKQNSKLQIFQEGKYEETN